MVKRHEIPIFWLTPVAIRRVVHCCQEIYKHLSDSATFLHLAADILSAVSFDQSGEYFATGDRGGRVVIFKKSGGKAKVGPATRRKTSLHTTICRVKGASAVRL